MLRTCYLLWLVMIVEISAFNLNVEQAIVYRGKGDSYFGYSISIYDYGGLTRILVGSPLESWNYNGKIARYGNIYSCRKTGNSLDCEPLDSLKMTAFNPTANQWLGATVSSSRGITLVCAPRHGRNVKGLCLTSKSSLTAFSVLNQNNPEEVTLFGLSATISYDGEDFLVAEPAGNLTKGIFHGVLHQSSVDESNIHKISFHSSHFPCSIASGRIANGQSGFIASVPFHNVSNFHGTVGLFRSSDRKVLHEFYGFQPGESFGSSLMVCDVNGDGRDDIFIGAPHHTDFAVNYVLYDIGRVYLYYQPKNSIFQSNSYDVTIKGNEMANQFGHSMLCMGDVNRDGYNDVAISAPYEDLGVVYIYYGSSRGLETKTIQKISGSSFSVSTFGYSLAGGADVDKNGHNDLVVGAYKSDSVVYVPAGPVIHLTNIEFNFNPTQINLNTTHCRSNGIDVTCSVLKYCLRYYSASVVNVALYVTMALDNKYKGKPRAFFLDTVQSTRSQVVTFENNTLFCYNDTVYISPNSSDRSTPISADVTVDIQTNNEPVPPVLNAFTAKRNSTLLFIKNNCGSSDCIPDLKLNVTKNMEQYIQGSGEQLIVNVSITNSRDEAYGSEFVLTLSEKIHYKGVERRSENTTVLCSPPSPENGYKLRCDIGHAFPRTAFVHLGILLVPDLDVFENNNIISINAIVTSSNPENPNDELDNSFTLSIPCNVENKWSVFGRFEPEDLFLNPSDSDSTKNETHAQSFAEIVTFQNEGPSDIINVEIVIRIPLVDFSGERIIELISPPKVEKWKGNCTDNQTIPSQNKIEEIYRCEIYHLPRSQVAYIRMPAKILSANFERLHRDQVKITSMLKASITELPFGTNVPPPNNVSITLTIHKAKTEDLLQAMPWWGFVISVVVAAILVAIVVFGLWKCGFFKRNRPEMTAVKQRPESNKLLDDNDK